MNCLLVLSKNNFNFLNPFLQNLKNLDLDLNFKIMFFSSKRVLFIYLFY
jgi:hypothetical protein